MARDIANPPKNAKLDSLHGIYTRAPEMRRLFDLIARVARSDRTVLLTGETGTGKELVARAIHNLSPRAGKAFEILNCATLSPTLLESELFGHVRGAFTGAIRDKKGSFSLADKGTLFLDEIAEIPIDIQSRLLRVLQEQTFVPVGGVRTVRVNVRLVSATNKILAEEVAEGRFRADLGYRVRVVPIQLPPLRDRRGDPEALMWHFIRIFNEEGLRRVEGVTRRALEAIRGYDWPGNVREMVSAVEYAFVVGESPVIDLDELPPELRGESPYGGRRLDTPSSEDDYERRTLLSTLNAHQWNRGATAAELGMSRSTLWRKMREHGLVRAGHK